MMGLLNSMNRYYEYLLYTYIKNDPPAIILLFAQFNSNKRNGKYMKDVKNHAHVMENHP